MKYVELTQGKRAMIDDEELKRASKIKWYYDHGYARHKDGSSSLYLHRFILGVTGNIDHKNGDGLDNRKENLRVCSQSKNMGNARAHKDSLYSKHKGVSFNKTLGYWTASICCEGKKLIKYKKTEKDAVEAYNAMALEFFGDFAKLNKI